MDRGMIVDHLAMAERHVKEGVYLVEKQRVLVQDLTCDGHDTTMASETLAQFEEMQAMHVAHRDRLQRELAEFDAKT